MAHHRMCQRASKCPALLRAHQRPPLTSLFLYQLHFRKGGRVNEGTALELSTKKLFSALLAHCISPPSIGFLLCQNPCVDRSWLERGYHNTPAHHKGHNTGGNAPGASFRSSTNQRAPLPTRQKRENFVLLMLTHFYFPV